MLSLDESAVFNLHPARKAQIALLTKEVTVPAEYSDFSNVFSEEKSLVLPK